MFVFILGVKTKDAKGDLMWRTQIKFSQSSSCAVNRAADRAVTVTEGNTSGIEKRPNITNILLQYQEYKLEKRGYYSTSKL